MNSYQVRLVGDEVFRPNNCNSTTKVSPVYIPDIQNKNMQNKQLQLHIAIRSYCGTIRILINNKKSSIKLCVVSNLWVKQTIFKV